MIEGMNPRPEWQGLKKDVDDLKYNLGNLSRELFEVRNEIRRSNEIKRCAMVNKKNQEKWEKLNSNPGFVTGKVSSEKRRIGNK